MQVFDTHQYFGGSFVPGVANTAEAIVSAMKARGIQRAILFSAHARSVDPLAGNRVLRKIIDQGDGLYGCLVTHTSRIDTSIIVMREQMSHPRFLGMAMAGTDPNVPVDKLVADEIMNAYRRYGKPLFLFTPNGECVHSALELARAYNMFRVVFIGMGGEDWRVAIAAAKSATNVILEVSGSLDRAKIPAAVETLGAHRLLFGSGSPHLDAAAALGLLEDSGIGADALRRIHSLNADRLFNLGQPEPAAPEPTIGAAPQRPT